MKNVSKLVFLALLVPVMGVAIVANPCGADGTLCDYHYSMNLTGLSGGNEDLTNIWTFSFDWVGPYRFNSPPNSDICCAVDTGSPKANWTPGGGDGFPTGAASPQNGIYASFSATDANNAFVDIYFQDISGDPNNGSTVDYHVAGPDTFWATLGPQTFGTNGSSVGYGFGGTGTDPPTCADPTITCTLTTTRTPLTPATTPEPASFLLLGTIAAGLGFGLRKRAKRSRAI